MVDEEEVRSLILKKLFKNCLIGMSQYFIIVEQLFLLC